MQKSRSSPAHGTKASLNFPSISFVAPPEKNFPLNSFRPNKYGGFGAFSSDENRGSGAFVSDSKVHSNLSDNFVRKTSSPNRRKAYNVTSLGASKKFLEADRNTDNNIAKNERVDNIISINEDESEVNDSINLHNFRVDKIWDESESKYQVWFKRRMILQWDYTRPAHFPWRTAPDYCSNYAVR